MATINNILGVIPAPVAAVLMLGGVIFYALGCIRLGYGAAVKPLVLDLIERAEHEIQGTKRGAERKAWVVKMLRAALSASKYGRLISWAITDETIGAVIQFFFDRMKRRWKRSKEVIMASTTYAQQWLKQAVFVNEFNFFSLKSRTRHQFAVLGTMVRNAGQLPQPFWLGAACGGGSCSAARCAART